MDDYHVVLSHGSGDFIPAFIHSLSEGGPIEVTSNTDGTLNPNNYCERGHPSAPANI